MPSEAAACARAPSTLAWRLYSASSSRASLSVRPVNSKSRLPKTLKGSARAPLADGPKDVLAAPLDQQLGPVEPTRRHGGCNLSLGITPDRLLYPRRGRAPQNDAAINASCNRVPIGQRQRRVPFGRAGPSDYPGALQPPISRPEGNPPLIGEAGGYFVAKALGCCPKCLFDFRHQVSCIERLLENMD